HDHQHLGCLLVIDDRTTGDCCQYTLRFLRGGLVSCHDRAREVQLAGAHPIREGPTQRGSLHLLRCTLGVVTRCRPVDRATTDELRGTLGTLPGPTSALLPIRLLTAARHLTPRLGVVGALTSCSQLRSDHLMHQRDIRLHVEHVAGQLDGPIGSPCRGLYIDAAHFATPPFASPILAALRTNTTPFFRPGTAPLSNNSPSVGCTACTVRPCVVLRTLPIRPGISLPLNTCPG